MILIRARCNAEMKKAKVYSIRVVCNKDSDIIYAVCDCVAGVGPLCTCKHLGALCYYLEEFFRISAQTSTESESCTSRLQTWHQPRKRLSASPTTLGNIKFIKAEHGREKKMISSNYDPRPLEYRVTTPSELSCLRLTAPIKRTMI